MNLLTVLMILSGCTNADPTAKTDEFVPRIPGGIIGAVSSIKPITKLSVLSIAPEALRLSWKNPRGYDHLDYAIKVYRMTCVSTDPGCHLDNSYDLTPGATLVKDFKESSFDDGSLNSTVTYTYFVCVFVEKKQGPCETISAQPSQTPGGILSAITAKFWELVTMVIGSSRDDGQGGQLPLSVFTLDPGITSFNAGTERVEVTGKISLARGGTLMYYADTKNNRILVMSKSTSFCDPTTMTLEVYEFCLLSASSFPFQVINILGQPDQHASKDCQQHLADLTQYMGGLFVAKDASNNPVFNRCMNRPTAVFADEGNNRLLVADSGNNRVLVYNLIPDDEGCDPNISPMASNKVFCDASSVIGKKDLTDLSAYAFNPYGDRTFDNPIDIKVYNNDLYVLDSGNHRLIKIYKYIAASTFNCSANAWDTSFCKFSAVLGQPGLLYREKFADLSTVGLFKVAVGEEDQLATNVNYLRNHFGNPTAFRFTDDGKLIISAFENFEYSSGGFTIALRGRVLVFNATAISKDIPDCTSSNFNDDVLGLCFANVILGQVNYYKLPRYGDGGNYLLSTPYGMDLVTDIDSVDGALLVVSPINNSIYYYSTYLTQVNFDFEIKDPNATLDASNKPLPDLNKITSIGIDKTSKRVFVSDTLASKIYDVNIAAP